MFIKLELGIVIVLDDISVYRYLPLLANHPTCLLHFDNTFTSKIFFLKNGASIVLDTVFKLAQEIHTRYYQFNI